jgi:lipid-A-disaccharide synthase
MSLRIGLVAGEASGDQLGAGLMREIQARHADAEFRGVGGEQMVAAGLDAWHLADELSVMGLAEVAGHLSRLLRIRRDLIRRFAAWAPDVLVGIDSPDFNLGLEARLRRAGIPTVHYVSPSVWAWRAGRIRKIRRAADLVLCLLPFEPAAYRRAGVAAEFVGHPLADRIPMRSDRSVARRNLGLGEEGELVAVMPGSRASEIHHLGGDFAGAVAWLAERRPDLQFVAPMARPGLTDAFRAQLQSRASGVRVRLLEGRSMEAMTAADAVLMASGTAALEAALIKRPMVVAYRVAPLTRWLLQTFGMVKVDRFSLPNLLSGKDLVPEILQDRVSAEALGAAVLAQLDAGSGRLALLEAFDEIHGILRRDADRRAADAVLACRRSAGDRGP